MKQSLGDDLVNNWLAFLGAIGVEHEVTIRVTLVVNNTGQTSVVAGTRPSSTKVADGFAVPMKH
jgi:hypothetical protein